MAGLPGQARRWRESGCPSLAHRCAVEHRVRRCAAGCAMPPGELDPAHARRRGVAQAAAQLRPARCCRRCRAASAIGASTAADAGQRVEVERRERGRDAAPEARLGGHVGHAREGRLEHQRAVVGAVAQAAGQRAPPPHRPSSGRRSRAARVRAGGAPVRPRRRSASALIVSSEGTMRRAVAPAAVVDRQDREAGLAQRLDLRLVAVQVAEACRAGTAASAPAGRAAATTTAPAPAPCRRAAADGHRPALVARALRSWRRRPGASGVGRSASWRSLVVEPGAAAGQRCQQHERHRDSGGPTVRNPRHGGSPQAAANNAPA